MKKLLLTAMLMGSAFAANATRNTLLRWNRATHHLKTTNEKGESLVLMWM